MTAGGHPPMRMMPIDNPELALAAEFVRDTGCHVFLTGKAGTGKTTFLHGLKQNCDKRLVVAAPTGVAAINAGGVTLHSFFQLPFGPFIPNDRSRRTQYRFSRAKLDIIRNLDLLVIDEISMVRADLLDGVDSVLRRYRYSDQPFGGVQLLMIGDLFQLPPVVKEDEWRLLAPHYASPYFFSSLSLQQTDLVTIELKHIYRQTDPRFIDLLNRVRDNRIDPSVSAMLNQRHAAGFVPSPADGTITLCTHNRQADRINTERLAALPHAVHRFDAEVEGDFPAQAFPTAAALHLKPGAQVMFVRNDSSPEKRYYNGKIGTIARIRGSEIRIRCSEDAREIAVEPVDWENVEYSLDPETQAINAKPIGIFRQYPLRLAWAITIHKSQGLTFDQAVIDAQAAFAHGQVYVALSRCRTLDGMVLSSPLPAKAMAIDPAVNRFIGAAGRRLPSAEQLRAAKLRYQQQLLTACFDFQRLRIRLQRMASLVSGNAAVIRVSGVDDIHDLQRLADTEVCTVGDNFLRQLQGLFSGSTMPADDPLVIDRITRASAYFQAKIASALGNCIPRLRIDTDNQALDKKVARARRLLEEEIAVKLAAVRSCAHGFAPSDYLRAVSAALTGPAPQPAPTADQRRMPAYSEADIAHHDLFAMLKDWRSRRAADEGVPHYRVLHQKTLIQIAVNLPDTLAALKSVRGIGDRLAARYGDELVALVKDYRKRNAIAAVVPPTPAAAEVPAETPRKARTDTRQASLALFEKGLSIEQIAEQRGLARSTIQAHLAYWVERGTVAVESLVEGDKHRTIQQALERTPEESLGRLKQRLGADISYADIRFVQAHLKFTASFSGD